MFGLIGAAASLFRKPLGKAAKWVGTQTGIVKQAAQHEIAAAIDTVGDTAAAAAARVGNAAAAGAGTRATSEFWSSPQTRTWLIGGGLGLVILVLVVVMILRRK